MKKWKHNYFYMNTNVVISLLTIKYNIIVPAELIYCNCMHSTRTDTKNKTIKHHLIFLQTFLNIDEFNTI